jgi:hypothetical protein
MRLEDLNSKMARDLMANAEPEVWCGNADTAGMAIDWIAVTAITVLCITAVDIAVTMPVSHVTMMRIHVTNKFTFITGVHIAGTIATGVIDVTVGVRTAADIAVPVVIVGSVGPSGCK